MNNTQQKLNNHQQSLVFKKIDNEHRLSVNGQVIWTLSENECTENVLKAIMHTYFIGVRDMHMLFDITLDHIFITGDLVSKFEDEEL